MLIGFTNKVFSIYSMSVRTLWKPAKQYLLPSWNIFSQPVPVKIFHYRHNNTENHYSHIDTTLPLPTLLSRGGKAGVEEPHIVCPHSLKAAIVIFLSVFCHYCTSLLPPSPRRYHQGDHALNHNFDIVSLTFTVTSFQPLIVTFSIS